MRLILLENEVELEQLGEAELRCEVSTGPGGGAAERVHELLEHPALPQPPGANEQRPDLLSDVGERHHRRRLDALPRQTANATHRQTIDLGGPVFQ